METAAAHPGRRERPSRTRVPALTGTIGGALDPSMSLAFALAITETLGPRTRSPDDRDARRALRQQRERSPLRTRRPRTVRSAPRWDLHLGASRPGCPPVGWSLDIQERIPTHRSVVPRPRASTRGPGSQLAFADEPMRRLNRQCTEGVRRGLRLGGRRSAARQPRSNRHRHHEAGQEHGLVPLTSPRGRPTPPSPRRRWRPQPRQGRRPR